MRERDVEAYLRKQVALHGGAAYKWVSPGRRSVPDRICIFPSGYVLFVEVKKPGKKPTAAQNRELQRLRDLRQWATWVRSHADVDELMARVR